MRIEINQDLTGDLIGLKVKPHESEDARSVHLVPEFVFGADFAVARRAFGEEFADWVFGAKHSPLIFKSFRPNIEMAEHDVTIFETRVITEPAIRLINAMKEPGFVAIHMEMKMPMVPNLAMGLLTRMKTEVEISFRPRQMEMPF